MAAKVSYKKDVSNNADCSNHGECQMSITSMTKNELLAIAKNLGIKGRHDLGMEELRAAIVQRQEINQAKPAKRLVKNTNIPWRRKYYYLDLDAYAECKEELNKVASQVQLMLKYMYDANMTSSDDAEQGITIAGAAINNGYVKSKIEPHVLFAYYRKTMEQYGLVFAGYNIDK